VRCLLAFPKREGAGGEGGGSAQIIKVCIEDPKSGARSVRNSEEKKKIRGGFKGWSNELFRRKKKGEKGESVVKRRPKRKLW